MCTDVDLVRIAWWACSAVFVRAQVAFLLQGCSPPSQMTMILVNMCQQLPLSAAVAVSPLDATWKCWNRLQALSADTV